MTCTHSRLRLSSRCVTASCCQTFVYNVPLRRGYAVAKRPPDGTANRERGTPRRHRAHSGSLRTCRMPHPAGASGLLMGSNIAANRKHCPSAVSLRAPEGGAISPVAHGFPCVKGFGQALRPFAVAVSHGSATWFDDTQAPSAVTPRIKSGASLDVYTATRSTPFSSST